MKNFKLGTYNYNQFEIVNEGQLPEETLNDYINYYKAEEISKGMFQHYCEVKKSTMLLVIA